MDELSTHGNEDLYDERSEREAMEQRQLEDDEAGGVFNRHDHPLHFIGVRDSRKWWRCERCEREFTEDSPTEYVGCCVSLEEQERQNDAYMEHGQPGGIA